MNKSEVQFLNRLAKLLWRSALVFSLLVMPVAAQTREQNHAEFHETYNLNSGGTVSVNNVSGYIHVTGWDENKVRVDAVKRPQRKNEDLDKVEIQVVLTIITCWHFGRKENIFNFSSYQIPLK